MADRRPPPQRRRVRPAFKARYTTSVDSEESELSLNADPGQSDWETVVTDDATGEAVRQRLSVTVEEGPEKGATRPLSGTILVGSHPDMDLVLTDERVSRRHLEIRPDAGGALCRDLKSKNGTHVGRTRVDQAFLPPGARVRLGHTVLRVDAHREPLVAGQVQDLGHLQTRAPELAKVFGILARVAPGPSPVLLEGETGTGKNEVAAALHHHSGRRGALIVIDCASIAAGGGASELLGHVEDDGSFVPGAISRATGGTLVLDEVSELPQDAQRALLRAVERREVIPVGSSEPLDVDFRTVATTRVPLTELAARGDLRRDLFFRLAVVRLRLPPLRERTEDLESLVQAFLDEQRVTGELDAEDLELLKSHSWPGNVRELRNLTITAAAAAESGPLRLLPGGPLGDEMAEQGLQFESALDGPYREARANLLEIFERRYVERLLEAAEGNISKAAREAAVDRNYIYRLLKKHDIDRSRFEPEDS